MAGEHPDAADDDDDHLAFTVDEMRNELERLRSDAAGPALVSPQVAGAAGPCLVPAAVPETPPGMRVSEQMHLLVDTVVSPDSQLRVGFRESHAHASSAMLPAPLLLVGIPS
jgi:hypothetical protein